MKKPKPIKSQWPISYAHPAHPIKSVYLWYIIAVLAGILIGMALWGKPGEGV